MKYIEILFIVRLFEDVGGCDSSCKQNLTSFFDPKSLLFE